MKKKKSKIIIWSEYLAFLPVMKVIELLSLKMAYRLSYTLFQILMLVDKKHKTRSIQHIIHSGLAKNEHEALEITRKNFSHFSRLLVEIIKAHQIINENNFREFMSIKMTDEVKEKILPENGENPQVIIVTGHCGNWELAGNAYCLFSGKELVSIMREMNNPKIGNLVYSRRQGVRHKTESKNKGLKPLLKALRNGSSIAIVADQHASTGEGVETVFFGHPARAHATPALLHLKTGIPIIVGALMRKNNGFSFDFHCTRAIEYRPTGRRDEDIRNITAMYTAELEKIIRERPGQWMWPHRRWLDINRNKKRIPKGADNNEENTCYDTQPG